MPNINSLTCRSITGLPYELIAEIFRSLVFSHGIRDAAIHLTLSTITAVSVLWRSVALSTCDLWQNIDWLTSDENCPQSSLAHVQQRAIAYLERSQSYPLDIAFAHTISKFTSAPRPLYL
ncbi:hypothetical protein DL93DRAFT_376472 [Clavulina sp. PMI_390]|nr:hypothetical protein DL93DRAFT_376472 [Clavulina sp. PMI_390]